MPARVVERAYFGHDAVLRVLPELPAEAGEAVSPLLVRMNGLDAPHPGDEVLISVVGPVMAWPEPFPGAEATSASAEVEERLTVTSAEPQAGAPVRRGETRTSEP
jgi:hypothetical protein